MGSEVKWNGSLSNLYKQLEGQKETVFYFSREVFGQISERTTANLFMIFGKLAALRGIDDEGEYVCHIKDGRLFTFRPIYVK